MIPVVIGLLGGAWLASRNKPTASIKRREILGPKSGSTYEVDDLHDQGIIVVHSSHAKASFLKYPDRPGYRYLSGQGHPEAIAWMIRDLGADYPKPAAKLESPP